MPINPEGHLYVATGHPYEQDLRRLRVDRRRVDRRSWPPLQ